MNEMSAVVAFENATLAYRGEPPVLTDVTLAIGPGLTLITGANGSGKSTLLETAASNLPLRSGTCSIRGVSVGDTAARRMRAYAPHEIGLIPALTLREHLILCGRSSDDEIDAALQRWGLIDYGDLPSSELSTGNRRKSWLLMCTDDVESSCVLLDEPFNALDEDAVEALIDTISTWLAQGRAVIVVAHALPARLRQLATRLVAIEKGEVHVADA